jgi:hypothetical protein
MVEIILIGSSILIISNVILRVLFKDKLLNYLKGKEYKQGYMNGYSNTKLYFRIFSQLPSNQWLNNQIYKDLSTREKLLKAINDKTNY